MIGLFRIKTFSPLTGSHDKTSVQIGGEVEFKRKGKIHLAINAKDLVFDHCLGHDS